MKASQFGKVNKVRGTWVSRNSFYNIRLFYGKSIGTCTVMGLTTLIETEMEEVNPNWEITIIVFKILVSFLYGKTVENGTGEQRLYE